MLQLLLFTSITLASSYCFNVYLMVSDLTGVLSVVPALLGTTFALIFIVNPLLNTILTSTIGLSMHFRFVAPNV